MPDDFVRHKGPVAYRGQTYTKPGFLNTKPVAGNLGSRAAGKIEGWPTVPKS